jgi:dTDP-4-dehydrorhamnose 3,5-epimerase
LPSAVGPVIGGPIAATLGDWAGVGAGAVDTDSLRLTIAFQRAPNAKVAGPLGRLATMERLPTRLPGPILLAPRVHGDERGFFVETYRRSVFAEHGIAEEMVQDNHSRSSRGIVRGMHFQVSPGGAAKLVRCATGSIVDVVVDIRRGSPTFGQWEAFELSDENMAMLYCPVGFAHGFCVVSDSADVIYKQSGYYADGTERGIAYDDPDVGIEWPLPVDELQPSQRDATAPRLADIADELPFVYAPD